MSRLVVTDLILDPARCQELLNPEFVADGPFFRVASERGHVGYRYDALPAAVADEPTAFGCIAVKNELDGSPALVAMLWDGAVTRLHRVSPSVDPRTTTVAGRGEVASLAPEGQTA